MTFSRFPLSDVWYRYEEVCYAPPVNEFGECEGEGRTALRLLEFPVIRTTPKGVWIHFKQPRFIRRGARKRFACPTKEEAKESFLARKRRQHKILSAQLRKVEKAIALMQEEAPHDL